MATQLEDARARFREVKAENTILHEKLAAARAKIDEAQTEIAEEFNDGVEAAAELFDKRRLDHEGHAAELRANGDTSDEFLRGVDDAAAMAGWDADAIRALKK